MLAGCVASFASEHLTNARFFPVDRIVESAVLHREFPGSTLAIGNRSGLLHLRSFGRLTFEPSSPATTPETIYDLASLTKVVVTTMAAMILVDEGKLDLDAPISQYLREEECRRRSVVSKKPSATESGNEPQRAV